MFSLFFFFFASFVLQSTSSLHREGHSKAQYGDTQRSTFSATAALIRLNIAFLVGKKKKKETSKAVNAPTVGRWGAA